MKKTIAIIMTMIVITTMLTVFVSASTAGRNAYVTTYGLDQCEVSRIWSASYSGKVMFTQVWDGGTCLHAGDRLEPGKEYKLLVRVQGVYDDITINGKSNCLKAKSYPADLARYNPWSDEYYITGYMYFTVPKCTYTWFGFPCWCGYRFW